jgi:hypothetical protein
MKLALRIDVSSIIDVVVLETTSCPLGMNLQSIQPLLWMIWGSLQLSMDEI